MGIYIIDFINITSIFQMSKSLFTLAIVRKTLIL